MVLEHLGLTLETLEDQLLDEDPTVAQREAINDVRRELISVRRLVWPTRELLATWSRLEHPLMDASTEPFLRDAHDHATQAADLVESLRDVTNGTLDLYMTALSNRMNEIMKVLTIIGTIFIPLTFIAGIYGMNFEYMPELQSPWGYPVVMGVMAVIGIIFLGYFRWNDWI